MVELVQTWLDSVIMVFCFSFIGYSLKYIDQVYDEGLFKKKIATLFSIVTGVFMGLLIAFDSSAAILLIAIISGVALTKKLDNLAHLTAAGLGFLIPIFLFFYPINGYEIIILIIPTVILTFSGISDEILDYIGDKKKMWLLTTRPIMKFTTLLFAVLGVFGWTYFFSMMAFDISYILTGWYSFATAAQRTSLGRYNCKKSLIRSQYLSKYYE